MDEQDWGGVVAFIREHNEEIFTSLPTKNVAVFRESITEGLFMIYTRFVAGDTAPLPKHNEWIANLQLDENDAVCFAVAEVCAEAQRFLWRVNAAERRHPCVSLEITGGHAVSVDPPPVDTAYIAWLLSHATDRQRMALVCAARGWRFDQIGTMMGVSKQAINGLINRGRARIRRAETVDAV